MTSVSALFLGEQPDEARFNPPDMASQAPYEGGTRVRPPGKPHGGLWTCRYDPSDPSLGFAWASWCVGEQWERGFRHGTHLWRVQAPDPTILTLDGVADLNAGLDRFRHQWMTVPPEAREPLHRLFLELDYQAVAAAGYDAVELTRHGLRELKGSWPPTLDGWDVPTILWLRWCFTAVEPFWERADDIATHP